mmetsp:Transcript_38441/g.43649  ORF Transcript_38441/g.43649 Transcript_38441/m.43649 type:complete len:333 (-) Transcript_38441:147-1145(-)
METEKKAEKKAVHKRARLRSFNFDNMKKNVDSLYVKPPVFDWDQMVFKSPRESGNEHWDVMLHNITSAYATVIDTIASSPDSLLKRKVVLTQNTPFESRKNHRLFHGHHQSMITHETAENILMENMMTVNKLRQDVKLPSITVDNFAKDKEGVKKLKSHRRYYEDLTVNLNDRKNLNFFQKIYNQRRSRLRFNDESCPTFEPAKKNISTTPKEGTRTSRVQFDDDSKPLPRRHKARHARSQESSPRITTITGPNNTKPRRPSQIGSATTTIARSSSDLDLQQNSRKPRSVRIKENEVKMALKDFYKEKPMDIEGTLKSIRTRHVRVIPIYND